MYNKILLGDIYSAILFFLPVLILGSISSLIAIYKFDYYEKMWGKGISFNVSLCLIAGYSLIGLAAFFGGIKFKESKREKLIANKQKAFLFGVAHTLIIYVSAQLHIALFSLVLVAFPFAFGMTSCSKIKTIRHCNMLNKYKKMYNNRIHTDPKRDAVLANFTVILTCLAMFKLVGRFA